MIYIAVCDDEKFFVSRIVNIIEEYLSRLHIECLVDSYDSGSEFTKLGNTMSKYDIVFMDINMKDLNGIDTAKCLRKYCPDTFLVFVTAYINYTLEGYKVEAIRYVLKDYNHMEDNIKEALDVIIDKMNIGIEKVTYDFVEIGKREILLSQIIYIENDLHKLSFHLRKKDREFVYSLYKKLDEVENDFKSNTLIRIHQSFLVNIRHTREMKRYSITLDNGEEIPVSKQRYKYVQSEFIKSKGEI